jgi:DNA invertase Pin-like site-specific DNA recombinase
MKYGYARVSTDDQTPALQLAATDAKPFSRKLIDDGQRREDVAALLTVNRSTLYRALQW